MITAYFMKTSLQPGLLENAVERSRRDIH